eukprot:TRINITY_DN819_c0_g1_i2.p1 TRINITY_DN819_c0_g1~~TRINITY_DN819_c0_g1_i2.p1  ORF type:complete len:125 (+),score=38.66 TRINITY_DN819_c0_g1_i2:73-447(+)
MIRRPPRSTLSSSSAASDVYKRQVSTQSTGKTCGGMEPKEMKVSMDEMMAERVDPAFRDYCAHLLIPLNQCRRREWYLPWKCNPERHAYEKCEFDEYMTRMKSNIAAKELARKEEEAAIARASK